ncbi:MAG: precorrin-8X methylmutase, partial [Candidatus Rokubacteria bacterium]|nr:precorrin-8X methylmutase [Candidatus Rokubacteria bacterium]
EEVRPIAERLIHASGMPDILSDLRIDPALPGAVRDALEAGRPIFTDCEMVRSGIIAGRLPRANELLCTLNDPEAAARGQADGITRSAAAVALWRPRLEGAVAVIGNAPTALFALLETLDEGAESPAAIIAFPVGFVGAAEAKAELVRDPRGVPYATLLGRRGGSAMAAAALNALLGREP